MPALLWTIAFFAILFFLAAFWNRHKLVKSNVINLLHEDQKPVKLHRNKLWKFVEALLGIALLLIPSLQQLLICFVRTCLSNTENFIPLL